MTFGKAKANNRDTGQPKTREDVYRELAELGRVLASERNIGWLAHKVLSFAIRITGADGGVFFDHTGDALRYGIVHIDSLNLEYSASDADTEGKLSQIEDLSLSESTGKAPYAAVQVAQFQRSLMINEAQRDDDVRLSIGEKLEATLGYHVESTLVMPLIRADGGTHSVIQLFNAHDREMGITTAFKPLDLEVVGLLAEHAASLFDSLDLFRSVVKSGVSMTSERDPDALSQRIIKESRSVANADCGALFLRHGKALHLVAISCDSLSYQETNSRGQHSSAPPVSLIDGFGAPETKPLLARAANTLETIHLPETPGASAREILAHLPNDKMAHYALHSTLIMPLVSSRGMTLGVLLLLNAQDLATGHLIRFNRYTRSMVGAMVHQAAVALDNQQIYQQLIETGLSLSAERDHAKLLERILLEAKSICNADGGTIYLSTEENTLVFSSVHNETLGIAMGGRTGKEITFPPLHIYDRKTGLPNHRNVATHVALSGNTVNVPDAYTTDDFDFSGTRKFDETTGYRSKSFLTVPLKDRDESVIGVLQLINARDWQTGQVIPFGRGTQPVVESLASQAAVALNNGQLLEAQRNLLRAFIGLIASAIDAKSPYTAGHCQRVPHLATLLADAAHDCNQFGLADFSMTAEDRYELDIASLLHDCGKVTTPEYVVDKATKLETIYNRIHEVRTRFEVLKRDREIAYWKALANGATNRKELKAKLDHELAQLDADFSFIANANVGDEFMDSDDQERVRRIAELTWQRTLDDRLGLSHAEESRVSHIPAPRLPATEHVLADKPEHQIPRPVGLRERLEEGGFKMDIPELLYDFGEIKNLNITRGTLTEEERFKINEHIIQTILMLEQLPFPRNLKRVPEYAGGHHEKMDGTGYPRQLTRENMSVPARIMAIADVFEALTASDRPYKKAKTLSETIKIMSFMVKDQHIDADLFKVFLTSGLYRTYAEDFLLPEQIDDVDIIPYLTASA